MKYLISAFFIFATLLAGCTGNQPNVTSQTQSIDLHILNESQVDFNGDLMTIAELEKELGHVQNPNNTIVEFKVNKDATMGAVTDVQEILRENGALKINYSTLN